MMDTFCPLMVNLKGEKCLVVGGGAVAERKVKVLLSYKADIELVSPSLTSTLQKMAANNLIAYIEDVYRSSYLNGSFLVIAATNNRELNLQIAKECFNLKILVNSASDPKQCAFFLPAILKKNYLTVAVSTSGVSPTLASKIRDTLDDFLGEEYSEFLSFLSQARTQIISKINDPKKRKRLLEHLASDEFFSVYKSLPAYERSGKLTQMIQSEKAMIDNNRKGEHPGCIN